MNETFKTSTFNPFPAPGKKFEFRFRRALWMSVRPWYGAKNVPFHVLDVYRVLVMRWWFPFICWNVDLGWFSLHGYAGWKPINVAVDPAFHWRDLREAQRAIAAEELFVQASIRGGINSIG